jgi:hypothetical protein
VKLGELQSVPYFNFKWKDEIDTYGDDAFPGHGRRPSQETQAAEPDIPQKKKKMPI